MKINNLKIALILMAALVMGFSNLEGEENHHLSLKRYALVVGANDGGKNRVKLQYAVNDAESMKSVLHEMGGVDSKDCQLLVDPDRAIFFKEIKKMEHQIQKAKTANQKVEFLFYYSGHSDEKNLMIGKEKISYKDLKSAIERMDADLKIAILDSCASGAFTRLKGGKKKPAFQVDTSHDMRGYAFLTSSSIDEASQESDRLQASFFTHFLTTGLRGAADISQDGRVTLNEAYHYAFNETLTQTQTSLSGPQHPNYDIAMTGTGDVIMTDIRQSSAVLTIGKDISGRVFIHNQKNVLVAELIKSFGQSIDLGLAEGTYRIINIRDENIYESRIKLVSGKTTELNDQQFSLTTKEHTTARGEPKSQTFHFSIYTPPHSKPDKIYDFNLFLFSSNCRSVKGLSLGLGFNFIGEDASGALFSGIGNFIGGNSSSLQAAGIANQVKGHGSGVQLAGILNSVSQDMTGAQAAIFYNYAGLLQGAQFSMLMNYVLNDSKYAQLALGANLANGKAQGVQAAIAFNMAYENLSGAQLVVGANVAADQVKGAQLAVGANAAKNITGAQIGMINLTRKITGMQIGVFNFGEQIDGGQIGVFNIAKSVKHASLGIFNFIWDGKTYLNLWGESTGYTSFGLKHGTDKFYNLYYIGADIDWDQSLIGWGYGVNLYSHKRIFLNADITAKAVFNRRKMLNENPALLASTRFSVGLNLTQRLSLVGGLSYNYFNNFDNEYIPAPDPLLGYISGDQEGIKHWVGFNLGLQFKLF